jgi:hypothetical protein
MRPFRWPALRRRGHQARPTVTVLDDRSLPSAVLGQDGVLHILGSEAGDSLRLSPGPNPGDVALHGVPGVNDGTVFPGVRAVRLDALAGDDHIHALLPAMRQYVQDAQSPPPSCDFGGGAGSDTIDIAVLVGAPGSARDLVIDAGPGANRTSVQFGDGSRGMPPPVAPAVRTRYRSGAGDDLFGVRYQGPLAVRFEVQADTGGGDDQVQLDIAPAAPPPGQQPPPNPQGPTQPPPLPDAIYTAVLATGAGADDVRVSASQPSDPCYIVWNAGIDLGAGDDRFAFDVVSGAEFLTLNTAVQGGTGADDVRVSASQPSDPCYIVWNAGIDLGAGDDRFGFNLSSVAEAVALRLAVRGDQGSDRLTARLDVAPQSTGTLAVLLDGGHGDDHLGLAVVTDPQLVQLAALVVGGPGFDTCLFTSPGVTVLSCEAGPNPN